MNATLVGADRLGNIPAVLRSRGIAVLEHISGRPATDQRRAPNLPRGTQLLILFTDFISHNAMQSFRRAAQEQGIPVLACRRSSSCLLQTLERTGLCGPGNCPCGLGAAPAQPRPCAMRD